ncbi:death domain-associated protein 6-like isoform X1 [Cloeon dipterum]|uniref:death domain-associated protein 6-like isoform X1 n=1 Tax=Cloeon dipterum TaxID=197152 RepID=UPI00321FE4D0
MSSEIEIINLSDDNDDECDSVPAPSAVHIKKENPTIQPTNSTSCIPSSSKAVDPIPSSSTQCNNAENGERIEKTKNEQALEMFLKGISTVAEEKEGAEALLISSNLEKRFYRCSKKFQNSNECYALISKFHNDVQSCPSKKWEYCAKFKECLKRRAQSKPESCNEKAEKTDNDEPNEEIDPEKDRLLKRQKYRKHLKILNKTLEKCMKKIKDLDQAEVDLDDEKGSEFLKKRRYEERVIKIYERIEVCYQKLGDSVESLKIPHPRICIIGAKGLQHNTINCAIDKFVNKKKFREEIQFPNYREIRAIVTKVNVAEKLNLTKEEVDSYAREAFLIVGQRIKKYRVIEVKKSLNDLISEAPNDPADQDPELLKKLMENRQLAEQRVTEVLEKYVEKSETIHEEEEELDSNADDNENEVDDIAEDGDEDDYEIQSENGDIDENSSCCGTETETETAILNGNIEDNKRELNYLEMLSDCDEASSGSDSERQVLMTNDEIVDSELQVCLEEDDCPMKKARLELHEELRVEEDVDNSFNPVIASVNSQVSGFSDSPTEIPERDAGPPSVVNGSGDSNSKSEPIENSTRGQTVSPVPTSVNKRQQTARKTFPRPPTPDPKVGVEFVILD